MEQFDMYRDIAERTNGDFYLGDGDIIGTKQSSVAKEMYVIEDLMDIREVYIDQTKPLEERIQDFREQMPNPYVFRYGNCIISLVFAKEGPTLAECVEGYLQTL